MKKLSFVLVSAILFGAQLASAQAYYSAPYSLYNYATPTYATACVSVSRDLTVGSRGSDVTSLQTFLVGRNYPGGGSWIVTGYFGSATRSAVMDFQIDSHLPQTGWVDASTRAALSSASCQGGYGYGTQYGNQYGQNIFNQYPPVSTYSNAYVPTPYNQPWYTPTPVYPTYPTYTNPYGNNYNNPSTTQCGWYTQAGYNYYHDCSANNGQNTNGQITISYLSPNSGAIGTSVTVFGTGFSSTNNSIRFGNGIIAGLSSNDGRTLSFVVPSTLSGYGSQAVFPSTYNVSVTNNYGATSNTMPFAVTSYGNSSNGAPSISNVSGPNTIAVNTTGTWIISLLNQYNSNYTSVSVNWGDVYNAAYTGTSQQAYSGTQSLTFTHSYSQTGTYTITFTASNTNGQSNTATATVYVTGTSNNNGLTISYVTPSSGHVGSQIQIVGSGFTGDNTVHFGNGGQMHLTSQSGNYIYYTIPQYLSPCDVQVQGSVCAQYLQQVTPGSYQMYVTNGNGTSNTLTYTVQ